MWQWNGSQLFFALEWQPANRERERERERKAKKKKKKMLIRFPRRRIKTPQDHATHTTLI
jgi:hypothetical protein